MKIIGTGSALPRKVVTNDMLAGFLDTNDEWIFPRTGIKTRHVITDENLEDLGTEAVRKALEMSGLKAEDIDLFIVSNVVSEYVTPGMSCIIGEKLGLKCPMFDINCACPGFGSACGEVPRQHHRSRKFLVSLLPYPSGRMQQERNVQKGRYSGP